jgi:hypothetical protein
MSSRHKNLLSCDFFLEPVEFRSEEHNEKPPHHGDNDNNGPLYELKTLLAI